MSTATFTGKYNIILDSYTKIRKMPNVSVEGETGKVELASNGIIKTEAATQERLVLTKMAGIFAARLASGWLPFEYTVAEFENGTRLPVNIRLGLSL